MDTVIAGYGKPERNRYYGFGLNTEDEQDRVIAKWLRDEPHPTRIIKQLLYDALMGRIVLKELPDQAGGEVA